VITQRTLDAHFAARLALAAQRLGVGESGLVAHRREELARDRSSASDRTAAGDARRYVCWVAAVEDRSIPVDRCVQSLRRGREEEPRAAHDRRSHYGAEPPTARAGGSPGWTRPDSYARTTAWTRPRRLSFVSGSCSMHRSVPLQCTSLATWSRLRASTTIEERARPARLSRLCHPSRGRHAYPASPEARATSRRSASGIHDRVSRRCWAFV